MTIDPSMPALITAAAGAVLTIGGGLAAVARYFIARLDRMEAKVTHVAREVSPNGHQDRIPDGVDQSWSVKDSLNWLRGEMTTMGHRVDAIRADVNDHTTRITRMEGKMP